MNNEMIHNLRLKQVALHGVAPPFAASAMESQSGKETTVSELLSVLWRSKFPILAIALAGGLVTGIAGLARQPLYEAKVQLIANLPVHDATPVNSANSQEAINETIDGHLTMLLSESHLRRVITALKAKGENDVLSKLRQKGETPAILAYIENTLNSLAAALKLPRASENLAANAAADETDAPIIEALRKSIRAGQELRSRVISVGFTDGDPKVSVMLADALAQTYVDYLLSRKRVSIQGDLAEVEARLPGIENDLTQAIYRREQKLLEGTVPSRVVIEQELAELSQLKLLLTRIATPTAAAQADSPSLTTASISGADPDQSNRKILESKIALLQEQVTINAKAFSGMRSLDLEVEAEASRYNDTLKKRDTLRQRVLTPVADISVLSSAWTPVEPRTLSGVYLIPPGFIFFGLIASLFTLSRRNLDEALHDAESAELALGVQAVGALPALKKPTAAELRAQVLGQPASDYGRALSRILISSLTTNRPLVIAVTSATSQDHKTELAWSVALAAGRFNKSALFIDLDSRRDELTQDFSFALRDKTVSHSLENVSDSPLAWTGVGSPPVSAPIEAAKRSGITLDFMPTPKHPTDVLARLGATNLRRRFDNLLEIYDVIVVNSPVAADAPEMHLLAEACDVVLFALAQGVTRQSVAKGVLKTILPDADATGRVHLVMTSCK